MRTDDPVYVVAGVAEHKTWWQNLHGGAPIRLRIRGQDLAGTAEVLTSDKDSDALVDGLTRYLKRFPRAARARQVRIAADGSPDAGDVRTAAAHAVMVRITLPATSAEPRQVVAVGEQHPGRY